MTIANIYTHAPGSRFLVICPPTMWEDMINDARGAMPPAFREKTTLNSADVISMELIPDDTPNRFNDLHALYEQLIVAAGKRSHFAGLLLLNLSALMEEPGNEARLKALGELLAMPDGLASQCLTLLYGTDSEDRFLTSADALDFDGKLKGFRYKRGDKPSLAELLERANLRCATPSAESLLASTLAEMAGCEQFNAAKFLCVCGDEHGVIAEKSVSEALKDPYSYVNRAKKAREHRVTAPVKKTIGFQLPQRSDK